VYAEHACAALEGKHVGGDRARETHARIGAAREAPQEALARGADHDGAANGHDLVQTAKQRQVVLDRLAEADAGIEQHPLLGDPRAHSEGQALFEKRLYVVYDIVVSRPTHPRLHGARLAKHVHQAAVRTALPHCLGHLGIAPQGGDVVHEARPRLQRGTGDHCLRGVDRDLGVGLQRGKPLDDGQHAPELLLLAHRLGAGAGGLAPDVDDVRALRHELHTVLDGGVSIKEQPSVGERVGGHVDDPHDSVGTAHSGHSSNR
jgi:hypothetical protein